MALMRVASRHTAIRTAKPPAQADAGPGPVGWRLARFEGQNVALRAEQQRPEAERERLGADNERLRPEREPFQDQRVNEQQPGEVAASRRRRS
jgi:hypothetical protein